MTVDKRLTQADIARELGLSEAAVSKFKGRGMPVTSIDEARSWHLFHVRPRISTQPARLYERQLSAVRTLWPVASVALRAGRLEAVRPALQQALRDVPEEARHLVTVDVEVMDALCAHFADLLRDFSMVGAGQAEPMSDSSAQVMGRVWYCVAAGERFPFDWLSADPV